MDAVKLFEQSTPIFTALGDPTRQRILLILAEKSVGVSEITESLKISQPATSHHLKILHRAGLVSVEKIGQQRIYTLTPLEAVGTVKELMAAIEHACEEEI